jgi:hypothetical protein
MLANVQEAFLWNQQCKKKGCCGTQWVRCPVHFTQREHHTLWKKRNGNVRGVESRWKGLKNVTQGAHMALRALCEKAPHLPEANRQLFDAQPLEDSLHNPKPSDQVMGDNDETGRWQGSMVSIRAQQAP